MPGARPHAAEAVLRSLTGEPATTSELYDRTGYPTLLRAGLIEYAAFRRVLEGLVAGGRAVKELDAKGDALWRLPAGR